MEKKNGHFAKRAAASAAALLIVAGYTPVANYVGLKPASAITASAAYSNVQVQEGEIQLTRGRANKFVMEFDSDESALVNSDFTTNYEDYFSVEAKNIEKSLNSDNDSYKYHYKITFEITPNDAAYDCQLYFYYKGNYFSDYYVYIYNPQTYEADQDILIETDDFVGLSDTVLKLYASTDRYTADENNNLTSEPVPYSKGMVIGADLNRYENDSDLYFNGDFEYDESSLTLNELDENGNIIAEIPYEYGWDNTHKDYIIDHPGTYQLSAKVIGRAVLDKETNTYGSKEYTLTKTIEIIPTSIENAEVRYDFYMKNYNAYGYSFEENKTLKVPYTNKTYTLNRYDYWADNNYAPYISVNGIELENGVDYEITGETSSKKMGEHTFNVEFMNGYEGEAEFTWEITDETESTVNINETYKYGIPVQPSISGNTWNGDVTYYYARQAKKPVWSTEVPTELGKYSVYAEIAGANGHDAFETDFENFEIVPRNFEVYPQGTTMTYGDELPELKYYTRENYNDDYVNSDKPQFEVEIWNGDTKIDPAVDKLHAGEYTLKIKNIDDSNYSIYYGTSTLTVLPKSVKSSDINVKTNINLYNGKYQSPEFTVTVNGEESTFEIYGQKRAKNIGEYTSEIELTGDYSGYTEAAWAIEDKEIETGLAMDINDIVESKKQVQFILSRNLTDGVAVESGFIYSKTGADLTGIKYDDDNAIDGTNIKKKSSDVTSNNGSVTFKVTDTGNGINIVGYVVYHTASGDFVDYTPIKSVTYNQAVNEKVASGLSIATVGVKDGSKVTFRVARQAENITVLESGFIYSKTGANINDVNVGSNEIDGNTIKIKSSSNSGDDTSLDFTITDSGKGINVKGYIMYETSNGIQYEYTDVLSTTYAAAAASLTR